MAVQKRCIVDIRKGSYGMSVYINDQHQLHLFVPEDTGEKANVVHVFSGPCHLYIMNDRGDTVDSASIRLNMITDPARGTKPLVYYPEGAKPVPPQHEKLPTIT